MTELTQERLKQLIKYDPTSGEFTWLPRDAHNSNMVGALLDSWNTRNANRILVNPNPDNYHYIKVDGCLYTGHRLAWLYVYGEWPNNVIDHINRTKSDNRIANLRDVTHKENMNNRVDNKGKHTHTTTEKIKEIREVASSVGLSFINIPNKYGIYGFKDKVTQLLLLECTFSRAEYLLKHEKICNIKEESQQERDSARSKVMAERKTELSIKEGEQLRTYIKRMGLGTVQDVVELLELKESCLRKYWTWNKPIVVCLVAGLAYQSAMDV